MSGECNSVSSPGLVSSSLTSESSGIHADLPVERGNRRWLRCVPKASDIYNLHRDAHMALQSLDAEFHRAPCVFQLQDVGTRPRPTGNQEELAETPVQVLDGRLSPSPWLRRHPILGPALGGLPPEADHDVLADSAHPELLQESPSHPLSPARTASAARSPSAKASFLEIGESGGGVRAVDEEILKLLKELLKGQQSMARQPGSSPPEAQRTAAEEAAQLAKSMMKATRKQQLSVSTFMALGVQDHRLLLLDVFLAWSDLRQTKVAADPIEVKTKEATVQASDDERPKLLVENPQVPHRIPAGNGLVPPILPGHTLRALLGEEVFLDSDGSIRGASLLLSMRPPRATRQFLQSFDICLPWAEVQQDFGQKPSQEASIQTSPRKQGDQEPKAGPSKAKDDLTPEQVLRRISGLQAEMTDMESSLEQLRQDLEAEPEEPLEECVEGQKAESIAKVLELPPAPAKRLSRLRQRLPESLSWLEEAARTGRQPGRRSSGFRNR